MAIFDAERFLIDNRIRTWPPGSNNVPMGYIGVQCPFCGDHSNHMHFRIGGATVACWRCGKHRLIQTLAALLKCPPRSAQAAARPYFADAPQGKMQPVQRATSLEYPIGCGPMQKIHRDYLAGRGFDPYELEQVWRLLGTDHVDPDYRWRIVAPIFYMGRDVSYQCRDVTGQQSPPYRAARPRTEVVSHKTILYGADLARKQAVVVVEGIMDAYRMGPGAVGTFGVEWTLAQADALANGPWQKVYLLYDPDAPGIEKAELLRVYLEGVGVDVEDLLLSGAGDPGSMPAADARWLMKRELKAR